MVQALASFQAAILDSSLSEGQITIKYDPTQVKAVESKGEVTIKRAGIVVNMPGLIWPGGHR